MGHPQVSVVMSVYKEPLEWITQSIDSILNQTYSNFQFLIINDNPFDIKLRDFLNQYQTIDSRIIVINNKENIGLTKSLNIGLKQSEGKYIARMDADDISLPIRFEKQVAYMESHPDVIVCGTNIKLIGDYVRLYINTIFENDIDIRGQMFYNSGFAHPTVFIRNSILLSNSIYYDENFRTAQDYKLWYDMSSYGKFANIKEPMLKYRISKQQVTSKQSPNQQSNRKIVSNLFKHQWLEKHLKDLMNPMNTSDLNNKILYQYYQRSEAYDNTGLKNILPIITSKYLNITMKERLYIFYKALNNLKNCNKSK